MRISNIEYYLPSRIVSNQELLKHFPEWDVKSFEKKVGIYNRHIAEENETALDLGLKAAEKVLKDVPSQEIDFLLFCTQSPDYYLPTSACILQDKLGLNKNIGALDFNLGCSGFVYGLSLAKGLIAAGISKKVLLVTAETYSKHINSKDKTNRSIFGDAGAACLIEKDLRQNIGEFVLGTDGSGYKDLITKNGAFRNSYDPEAKEIAYGDLNIYTDNNLYMNGPEIFNFTIDNIPNLVNETLQKNNLRLEDVDYYVFHQANAFMLNFLRKKIGIPKDKFFINLKETGNTVSCTIPIALKEIRSNGILPDPSKVMLVGFGVGLSLAATIVEF